MKFIKYLLIGILFGILMSKAEIISWYRIYEMFKFQSFHMYGIIGSAVILGALFIQLTKRFGIKDLEGNKIAPAPKQKSTARYLIGGTLFGLGWAMVGACPGPMFVLLGKGIWSILIVIVSATAGTYVYGITKHKLPH